MKKAFIVVNIILVMMTAMAQEKQAIQYQVNAPFNSSDDIVYSIYSDADWTVAFRHYDTIAPDLTVRKSHNLMVTGPNLGGKLGWMRDLYGVPVLVPAKYETDLQVGKMRLREEFNKVIYERLDTLDYQFTKGHRDTMIHGYEARHYELTGSYHISTYNVDQSHKKDKGYHFSHDLWLTPELPYSEAPFAPLRTAGRRFTYHSGLNQLLYQKLKDRLHNAGLLLRMEHELKIKNSQYGSNKAKLLVSEIKEVERKDVVKQPIPVIPQSIYSQVSSIAFITHRMDNVFHENKDVTSSMQAWVQGPSEEMEFKGKALYGTNQINDFVLTLMSTLPEDEQGAAGDRLLCVFLARPGGGVPSPGRYQLQEQPLDIEDMAVEELQAATEKFNAMAMVVEWQTAGEDPQVGYYLTHHPTGTVKINAAGNQLKGSFDISLSGWKIADEKTERTLSFKGEFMATTGLKKIGKSKVAQLLPENKWWQSWDKAMQNPNKVYRLKYYNDDIDSLPSGIGKLKRLRELELKCKDLVRLPESITRLENLEKLYVKSQRLEEIPADIGNLTNLHTLHLNGGYFGRSNLTELPPSIGNLTNLKTLVIESSDIQVLPDTITNLTNLTTLKLDQIDIRELPDGFKQLHQLRELKISNANLDPFPEEIGALSNLEVLTLIDNDFSTIPSEILSQFTNLRKLNLSQCMSLEVMPLVDELRQLPKLEELRLMYLDFTPEQEQQITEAMGPIHLRF